MTYKSLLKEIREFRQRAEQIQSALRTENLRETLKDCSVGETGVVVDHIVMLDDVLTQLSKVTTIARFTSALEFDSKC